MQCNLLQILLDILLTAEIHDSPKQWSFPSHHSSEGYTYCTCCDTEPFNQLGYEMRVRGRTRLQLPILLMFGRTSDHLL
jgi:hypothetical protein